MKLKFCAIPITFSFFLCLFPVNFAGLSLVFSYRTLHRAISWACRMKNHLSPFSHMVKCQSKYLWAVKVDFWWTWVNFLSRAACAGAFMCLETCMFPLARTQISQLRSLSGIFYSCFCSLQFASLLCSWRKWWKMSQNHRVSQEAQKCCQASAPTMAGTTPGLVNSKGMALWWLAETGTRQQVRISVSHSSIQTLCGFPVCGVGSMSAGHPWNPRAAEPSRKKVREEQGERELLIWDCSTEEGARPLTAGFLPPSVK